MTRRPPKPTYVFNNVPSEVIVAAQKHGEFAAERDKYLLYRGFSGGPCEKAMGVAMRAAVARQSLVAKERFSRAALSEDAVKLIIVGWQMETETNLLKAANAELEESKKTLQNLVNEIQAMGEIVGPELLRQAQDLRTARMTAVREINESLVALRDIRKFFLESDHEKEVERLRAFVGLCRDLQALKRDGVLDAVSDTMLRMMSGGPHERK